MTRIEGLDAYGAPTSFVIQVPATEGDTGAERLSSLGLHLMREDGKTLVDMTDFGSQAEKLGFDFDQEIVSVRIPTSQLPKELMWIPALLLFGLVVALQRRRREPRANKPERVATT